MGTVWDIATAVNTGCIRRQKDILAIRYMDTATGNDTGTMLEPSWDS